MQIRAGCGLDKKSPVLNPAQPAVGLPFLGDDFIPRLKDLSGLLQVFGAGLQKASDQITERFRTRLKSILSRRSSLPAVGQ